MVLDSLTVIGKVMSPKLDYQDIQNPLVSKELSAKTALAIKLNELISLRGLSQTEVADITGMTQPKVSQICRYKLQNISLERLMQALVSLDQRVEIVVQPAHGTHSASITVHSI